MKSRPLLHALCLFSLLALTGACSDASRDEGGPGAGALRSDDGLLRYIPADSPYVAAAAEPLPDDVRDELQAKGKAVIRAYGNLLRVALRQGAGAPDPAAPAATPGTADGTAAGPQADPEVEALITELTALLTPEGMESAGIDRRSTMALYGYELWPVLRVLLSDEGHMEATLSRLEERLGEKLPAASVDGHSYRYAQVDRRLRLVVAVLDGYLVVSLLPADPPEALLKSVLGLELPGRSIAESGTLAEIAAKYGFTPYGLGFLDLERVTEVFLDDQSGINREILSEAGVDVSGIPDVCRAELRSMAAVMPRIVSGYTEITGDRIRSNSVFELRSDIAKGLATLTAPVPGLGRKGQGGLFTFGMSLNPQAARDFYAARLDALEAEPYQCEWFADLQDGVAQGRAMLNQPLPPVVYSFRGFLAAVDRLDGMDLAHGQPPTDIDMRVLVATDNAEALVAMGAMFSPEIASLNLQPDSQPVSLPLPPAAASVRAAHVAMSDRALALSVGQGGGARLPDMLAAPAAEPSPFMSSDLDAAAYYGFIAQAATRGQDGENRSPEFEQAFRETMTSLQSLVQRISLDVQFTERGIEIPSTAELVD